MILIKLFFRPANGKCPLIQIRLNKLIYLIIYHWDIYGYILMKRLHSNIILIKKIIKPIRTLKLFVNSIIFSSLHFISNLPFLLYGPMSTLVMWFMIRQKINHSVVRLNQFHNASLAITRALRGTSQGKLYQKLGL